MILYLLIICGWVVPQDCEIMHDIRADYHKIANKEQLEEFMVSFDSSNCTDSEPYLASATMQKAKHVFWPGKKLKYFNKGRKRLEKYINENPNKIEARYVRCLVQSELPGFLGYKKHIKIDSKYILENMESSSLPQDYKDLILENINKIINK